MGRRTEKGGKERRTVYERVGTHARASRLVSESISRGDNNNNVIMTSRAIIGRVRFSALVVGHGALEVKFFSNEAGEGGRNGSAGKD